MNCPRCDSSLEEQKHSGVAIDSCPKCRGVWLDRGELEKLIEGERRYYGEDDDDDEEGGFDMEEAGRGPRGRRGHEKEGFFQNLVEMFGGDGD